MTVKFDVIYFFFFHTTATTEIYTLSLHDALPISNSSSGTSRSNGSGRSGGTNRSRCAGRRSEEHTSELQSQSNLVCRLLLEKKKCRAARCWSPDPLLSGCWLQPPRDCRELLRLWS